MQAALYALLAYVPVSDIALAQSAPKWGPSINFEAKPGTKRSLGEADLFVPFAQTDTTLLFGHARARFDDDSSREGNFGLGLRHMLTSGWNLGVYGYYDRKRTDFDNYFNQATIGIEALGRDLDFRANVYLPFGDRAKNADSFNTAAISGTNVLFYGGEERALRGFDAEVGWRVPFWSADDTKALRLYAGLFHFDDNVVKAVTGPRLRAELTMYEIPSLWEGTRLTLGAEFQHDDVRGSQGFGLVRLSVPLGASPSTTKLTAQERRMTDRIVRDADIVTQAGTFGLAEKVNQVASGGALAVVDSATTPGADLQTAVTNAGAGSTVILSGTFNTTDAVALQQGQTMMGVGSVAVRSASGRTAVLNASTGATVDASTSVSAIGAITMANDSTLRGMTINQNQNAAAGDPHGVSVQGLSNVTIANNVITVTASNGNAFGTYILNSSNITVTGNTISAMRPGAFAAALYANNSSLIVANNTLSATGNTARTAYLVADLGDTLTILPGSSGNVFGNGVCEQAGVGTFAGSFGYIAGGVAGNCP